MPDNTVNTTMDREVLLSPAGAALVRELDALAQELDRRQLPVTSWLGALPDPPLRPTVASLLVFAAPGAGPVEVETLRAVETPAHARPRARFAGSLSTP